MSHYNSDNFFDNEFEDRGDVGWSEFDWQRYLVAAENDITTFVDLYKKTRLLKKNPLEEIARLLGFSLDGQELPEINPDEPLYVEFTVLSSDSEEEYEGVGEPFTVHRYPSFVLMMSLHKVIEEYWVEFITDHPALASPYLSWHFGMALKNSQQNATMSMYATEIGEYPLAVTHLKHSLKAVNDGLFTLQQIPKKDCEALQFTQTALFDLRDAYLRIMKDLRMPNDYGELE